MYVLYITIYIVCNYDDSMNPYHIEYVMFLVVPSVFWTCITVELSEPIAAIPTMQRFPGVSLVVTTLVVAEIKVTVPSTKVKWEHSPPHPTHPCPCNLSPFDPPSLTIFIAPLCVKEPASDTNRVGSSVLLVNVPLVGTAVS